MDVADSLLGFILYFTGFLLLLLVLGILERLWPAAERNKVGSDQTELVAESVRYKNVS